MLIFVAIFLDGQLYLKSNVSVNVTKFLDVNRTKINNWYIYILLGGENYLDERGILECANK